jgi:choline dehydrogenase-like flavoprotein
MAGESVDVLIVGAGASGAAIAWSLAETRMDILCLDQGGWVKPSDYPGTTEDWESRAISSFGSYPNTRRRPEDYPVNDLGSPISPLMWNGVGGSTILWGAHFPRFHPSDFRVRTLDGVADDWPIDYATLEPYYDLNDRMMGVSGLSGNPAYPPKDVQTPPISLGKLGVTIAKGFNRLGWHWWPADGAIASQSYQGRESCVNAGLCIFGCAQGAKASTDITYWPSAVRRGVRLETHCRVREISLASNGLADGVVYVDSNGVTRKQKAEIVILACNAIGTARLLLLSSSGRFPDGLANRSGLVGRNLMFHPWGLVTGFFEEPVDGFKGPIACSVTSQEFYETDRSRGFVRGYTLQTVRSAAPGLTAMGGVGGTPVPWGRDHRSEFERVFGRTISMNVICEDLPELENRVELDPEMADGDGIPAPRVIYRLGENSSKMIEHGVARAREVMEAAGATETTADHPVRNTGWHLMGTARMGQDPETSVVNSWGRCHDVPNLFIVDGSVFVTSGGVNPCSTIQAVALYIGEQIKKNLENLFD